MNEETRYWGEFYREHRVNDQPSGFADYVCGKYLSPAKNMLELGCGNGRDAFFFAARGVEVVGVDQVEEEICFLNDLKRANVTFLAGDFTEMAVGETFDYIYSRFTFHAIDEVSEDKVVERLPEMLKPGGLFFLEARTLKDRTLEKWFGTGHYRRYLSYEKTVRKIADLGFDILEMQESRGLARYESEDPYVLRIVARNPGGG